MAVSNPLGSSGAPAPAPTGGVVNPFASAARTTVNAVTGSDPGGNSIFGFLGNVWHGVTGIVGGVSSLIGQGVHDALLLAHGPSSLEHPEDFELFQTAKALPSALAKDYKSRYGWNDFSHGDIWGGIKDIGAGLYDNPIAYIGDALMVGGAAEFAAKAGVLGDAAVEGSLASRVLGPGGREVMSMTGPVEEQTLGLSQNPVARFAQNHFIDAFSLSPEKAVEWAQLRNPGNPEAMLNDLGGFRRAQEAIQVAKARTGTSILRPTFSAALENRFTSRTMAIMGIQAKGRVGALAPVTKEIIDGLSTENKALLPDVIQGTLPIEGPSMRPSMRYIDEELEATHAGPPPAVSPNLNGDFVEKISKGMERGQWRAIDPANPLSPAVTPTNPAGDKAIAVFSADETLSDAGTILRDIEAKTGHRLVSVENNFADAGSYDGYAGYFEDPATGEISKVSVTTPSFWNEQAKWASTQKQIAALSAEADALRMDIAAAGEAGAPEAEARLAVIQDELEGAQAANSNVFRFSRRAANAAIAGIEYPEVLQAADKLSSITHLGTARVELAHGALTFRKMWDRAFLPMRSVRFDTLMTQIEKDLQGIFAETGTNDAALLPVVDAIKARLGVGHPAIEKAIGDAITTSKVDEIIPFSTEEVMPAFIDPAQPQLGGALATGEKTIKSNWWGSTDPAEAAHIITNKIRALTRDSIVVHGEFPTFSWKEMLAQVEADPFQELPSYYPHVKPKNFVADAVMMRGKQQTQLLSETARMDKNEAILFEKGLYEKDPIEAYSRVYAQIAKHDEMRDALWTIKEKYGRTPTDEELQAVAMGSPSGEVYMSMKGVDAMLDARKTFIGLKHDGMMAGLSPEQATMEALKEVSDRALTSFAEGETAADEIWAIPAHVAKTMDRYARPLLNLPPKASFFYSTIMNGWKTSVLGLSPRWLVNNTLGNLVMMGVKDPAAIRRYIELLMSPSKRAYVEAMFGDRLTASVYRDFITGEMRDTTLVDNAKEVGLTGTAQKLEGFAGKRFLSNEAHPTFLQNPIKYMSQHVYRWNQINEDAGRMAVAITTAQRDAQLGIMSRFESTYKTMVKINEAGLDSEAEYAGIAKSVNDVLGDYVQMSPIEKSVKQYLMPFYPFYRHMAVFVAKMPFESPFKSAILRNINQIDSEMKGALPEYMQNGQSNEIMPGWWMRIGNANPLQAITTAYAPALTNPLLGLTIQRLTGTNPFGEPWRAPPGALVETHSGAQYEIIHNPDGSFAGVKPITGTWEPNLMSTVMGMVPQFGLITGISPFKYKSFPLRALGMTGVSVSQFDQPYFAYQEALNKMEALTAGANATARYG